MGCNSAKQADEPKKAIENASNANSSQQGSPTLSTQASLEAPKNPLLSEGSTQASESLQTSEPVQADNNALSGARSLSEQPTSAADDVSNVQEKKIRHLRSAPRAQDAMEQENEAGEQPKRKPSLLKRASAALAAATGLNRSAEQQDDQAAAGNNAEVEPAGKGEGPPAPVESPAKRGSLQEDTITGHAPYRPSTLPTQGMVSESFGSSERGVQLQEDMPGGADPRFVCFRVEITGDGADVRKKRVPMTFEEMLEPLGDCSIKTYREFRHVFPQNIPVNPGESLLRDDEIGLFHTFSILDLDGGMYICAEKMGDKLEFMLVQGDQFCSYACRFRATEVQRPETLERPIIKRPKVSVSGNEIIVGDFITWVSGHVDKVWQLYSLIGHNCDLFSSDLLDFLNGKSSPEQSWATLCSNKFMMLSAIESEYTVFFRASPELKQDREVVAAAIHAAANQCKDEQLKTVLLQTIGHSEAGRFLGLRELPKTAKRGDKRALFVLHLSLIDESASVRKTAVDALTQLAKKSDKQVIASIIQFSKDKDWKVRWRAVEGLAQVAKRGNRRATAAVIQRLEDNDTQVRAAAVEALAQLAEKGDQQALDAVARRLEDPEKDVRNTATAALAQMEDTGEQQVNATEALGLDEKKALLALPQSFKNSEAAGRRSAVAKLSMLRALGEDELEDRGRSPRGERSGSLRPDRSASPRGDRGASLRGERSASPRPERSASPRPEPTSSPRGGEAEQGDEPEDDSTTKVRASQRGGKPKKKKKRASTQENIGE